MFKVRKGRSIPLTRKWLESVIPVGCQGFEPMNVYSVGGWFVVSLAGFLALETGIGLFEVSDPVGNSGPVCFWLLDADKCS